MAAVSSLRDARDAPVAVVTGGSRGIGAAVADGLAADGHDVLLAYRRDHEAAAAVQVRVEGRGRRCVTVAASLAEPAGCRTVVESARAAFHRVDALVHCAGIACASAPVADTDPAVFERLLAVHLCGPLRLTQQLLGVLRRQERSSIVFVSSAVTEHMRALGAPYNVAKAAMEALARTLANEERGHGIRVNIVSPGLTDTELGRRFVRWAHGRDIHELARALPYGRVCAPEDVAGAVRWLVSEDATYLSGQNIRVNGGDDSAASNVEITRATPAAAEGEPG
jgi:NAD(P)-dependent dehydrogenase (short-subunit alcohol dehydrogenase family)